MKRDLIGGLRTLFGGRAGIFARLCKSARQEAFRLMQEHAARLGANAVIGVRYDTANGRGCRGALLRHRGCG